jgi:hypothetical protein
MNKELDKAIKLYNQSREILEIILIDKFIKHTQYYWIKKGIGSATIQKLKNNIEEMQITTLINLIQRMEQLENE